MNEKSWEKNQRAQVTHSKVNLKCTKPNAMRVRGPFSGNLAPLGPHLPSCPAPALPVLESGGAVGATGTAQELMTPLQLRFAGLPSSAALSPQKLSL